MDRPKRAAKVGYRKTRTGCLKCRSRRVKCDERLPTCANCERLGLDCEYSKTEEPSPAQASTSPMPEPTASKSLQRMELRLLHAWTSRAFSHVALKSHFLVNADWCQAWFIDLPQLAFDHDNLLYALLAFSATQLTAGDLEIASAQYEFWALALRHQRQALATPGHHREAVVLAGYLICLCSFGMIRERELTPYTPPLDWFELTQGAQQVCPDFDDLPQDSPILRTTLKVTAPMWQRVDTVDPVFQPVLSFRTFEEEKLHDDPADVMRKYEKALAVISGFRHSIVQHEPPWQITRWLCTLPQLVPSRYVQLLREQRPRALVILLCFWSILREADLTVLRSFGDIEGTLPGREIAALVQVLPVAWQGFVPGLLGRDAQTTSNSDEI